MDSIEYRVETTSSNLCREGGMEGTYGLMYRSDNWLVVVNEKVNHNNIIAKINFIASLQQAKKGEMAMNLSYYSIYLLLFILSFDLSFNSISNVFHTGNSGTTNKFAASLPHAFYSIEQESSRKNIALTFDDGPHYTLTPRLLDVLKEKNVTVTFFVMGIKVAMHPEIVKRAHDEGLV